MKIIEVVTKVVFDFIPSISSKWLLFLFGGSFLVPGLFYPQILTFSPIYMGLFVGYLSTKLEILSLLDLIFGFRMQMSYLSLVYDFNFLLAHHSGLTILGINTVYWLILAVSTYDLLRRIVKPVSWKTIFVTSLLAVMALYLIGSVVIYLNFENVLSDTICCRFW